MKSRRVTPIVSELISSQSFNLPSLCHNPKNLFPRLQVWQQRIKHPIEDPGPPQSGVDRIRIICRANDVDLTAAVHEGEERRL